MKANKLTKGANLRWESSRMMLPEHVAALKKHAIDKEKIERPSLAEDDLAKIEHMLQTAIKDRVPVELSYYKDGFIKQTICYPQRLDPINKLLTIYDAYGMKEKYAFLDIMGAKIGQKLNNN